MSVGELLRTELSGNPALLDKTGFNSVYRLSAQTRIEDLILSAAEQAKAVSGVQPDTVIVVSSVLPQGPGPGYMVASELELSPKTRIVHLQDACTGFLQALDASEDALTSGSSTSVLIIAGDSYSRWMSKSDPKVHLLFSDAASAVLVSSERVPPVRSARRWVRLGAARVTSHGSQRALEIRDGSLAMNGAAVFQFAVSRIPQLLNHLRTQGIDLDTVDRWYVHQGSRVVVDSVAQLLDAEPSSLFRSASYGNVVGSAIPFQLFEDEPNEVPQVIGLLAFGMGLTASAVVVRQDPS